MKVGLRDVDAAVLDHPAEASVARFLLAAGYGERQGVGDDFCVFEMVEGTGLLKVDGVDVLEHSADFDGLQGIVGTVRVGVDVDRIAKFLA